MRSPRTMFRMHNFQHFRTLGVMVLIMFFSLALVITLPSYRTTFLSYKSWNNVSVYHLVKMHLSGRPTHVTSMSQSECRTVYNADANKTLLYYNEVNFYDDVVVKMKNLNETQQWKQAFHPLLNRTAKLELMRLYGMFKEVLDRDHLPHILMHGSAIGAWRHHGITPWDDDIDIAIDATDWFRIREVLSCVEGYTLDADSNSKWSFYKDDSPLILGGPKRWPFLDLFLFTHDDHFVWALNYVHLRKFVFPKEDMFPIQLVPFECFLVPVPRHLKKVLEHQYVHPFTCTSHYSDHRTGEAKVQVSVPCSDLSDMYKMYNTEN